MPVVPTRPIEGKEILSPGEACYVLGVSWNTLKGLIRDGEISAKRKGRRYLIPRSAIQEYLSDDKLKARAFIRGLS